MMRLRHVDTVTASELRNMQDVLVSKETEVVQSKSTASGLATGEEHTDGLPSSSFCDRPTLPSMKRRSVSNKTWRRCSSWKERSRVS